MPMKRLASFALIVLSVVAGLAVLIPNRETADLGGTAWTLVAYGPTGAPIPAAAPGSIAFERNGRMSGQAGCNTFFGSYRADGGQLTFDGNELAFTTMDCPEETPAGQQERFLRHWLHGGAVYTQTADRLTLRFDGGQTAEYARAGGRE